MGKGSKILIIKREKTWTKVTSERDVAIEKHGFVTGFGIGIICAGLGFLIMIIAIKGA